MYVNMFFFRNLMFLTLLAFVSWLILCYFNSSNESIRESRQHLDLENSLTDMLICESKSFQSSYGHMNFIFIFTGIYILAKLIEMIEIYFAPNFRFGFNWFHRERCENLIDETVNVCEQNDTAVGLTDSKTELVPDMHASTFTVEDYRKITISLREEITKICKRNKYLDQRVSELEQYNLLLMGKGLLLARKANMNIRNNNVNGGCDGEPIIGSTYSIPIIDPYFYGFERRNANIGGMSLSCSQFFSSYFCTSGIHPMNAQGADGDKKDHVVRLIPPQQSRWMSFHQNIFIANRYFHINRPPMTANDISGKLGIQSYNTGEFTQIWHKYLRMCSLYHGISSEYYESNIINGFPSIPIDENVIESGLPLNKFKRSELEVNLSSDILAATGLFGEADTMTNPNQGFCNPTPIVVTTADLEQLQGF